jgi:hypothetical protein
MSARRFALAALAGAALATGTAPRAYPDAPAPQPRATAAAAPRIVVEPAGFDFGRVRATKAAEKEFLVRNHGRAELVIQSVVSSCGCTGVITEAMTVKPGGSTTLRVTFTAPDTPGRLSKSVVIQSNDPARPSLDLKIEATVVAAPSR